MRRRPAPRHGLHDRRARPLAVATTPAASARFRQRPLQSADRAADARSRRPIRSRPACRRRAPSRRASSSPPRRRRRPTPTPCRCARDSRPLTIVLRLVPSGRTMLSYCAARSPAKSVDDDRLVVEAVLLEHPLQPARRHVVGAAPQPDARVGLQPIDARRSSALGAADDEAGRTRYLAENPRRPPASAGTIHVPGANVAASNCCRPRGYTGTLAACSFATVVNAAFDAGSDQVSARRTSAANAGATGAASSRSSSGASNGFSI